MSDFIPTNLDINTAMDTLLKRFENEERIQSFIEEHKVKKAELVAHALILLQYLEYLHDDSMQKNAQVEGILTMNKNRQIEFNYRYRKEVSEIKKIQTWVDCLYIDESILKARLADFKTSAQKSNAYSSGILLGRAINKKEPIKKGLFISGINGVGKTHMLAALAYEFYRQETKVVILFYPEFVRHAKSMNDKSAKIIKYLQKVPVLMIDDIGAEMQTSTIRDEILLPILNSRMNNHLLTFFSSNFNLKDLEHHFKISQYGETEPMKAKRIIDRITTLTDYVEMLGENRRVEQEE